MNIVSFLLGFIACFGFLLTLSIILAYKDFKRKQKLLNAVLKRQIDK